MKTHMILGIGIAYVMGSLASAAEQIDAATLGKLDAAVTFCRQLNPAGESTYNALRVSLIGQLSASALEAMTQTAEYREALAAGGKTLSEEPQESAVKDCMALAPAGGTREPQAHKHK